MFRGVTWSDSTCLLGILEVYIQWNIPHVYLLLVFFVSKHYTCVINLNDFQVFKGNARPTAIFDSMIEVTDSINNSLFIFFFYRSSDGRKSRSPERTSRSESSSPEKFTSRPTSSESRAKNSESADEKITEIKAKKKTKKHEVDTDGHEVSFTVTISVAVPTGKI